MRKATQLYQACLSPQQQKLRSLDYLISQGTHSLSDDEHVIALKATDNNQSGWYCNICEKEYGTPRKDTIVKHMLSTVHWLNVTSKYMMKQEHSVSNVIAKNASIQLIQKSIQNGVVIATTQASLPFTAGELALNLVQKTILTINQNSEIPQRDINQARQLGFHKLAAAGERLNILHCPVNKNQFGEKAPVPINRTQVSRKITTIGNDVVTLKKKFYQDVIYVSIFLDESTTTAMQTRPVYCGLIGIKPNFEWLLCSAGQTNTAGCETGEVYFNSVKDVFNIYDIWSRKKILVLMAVTR